jgi:hypothetical protein
MFLRVVWYILTDISEKLIASVIRVMKRRLIYTRLHGVTSQKSAIFIILFHFRNKTGIKGQRLREVIDPP